ncbi:hypothetical protein GOV09_05185 [Candidatus Woesearchaeota archaeon]|nr:hypothetical protein [Candidatus Woesearchaeota archaeon]
MKRTLLFACLVIVLSSFSIALDFSYDLEDYHFNGQYYVTDGLDGDAALNSSTPSNGEHLDDYGWIYTLDEGTATYTTGTVYRHNKSIDIYPGASSKGQYIKANLNSSIFKGVAHWSIMATSASKYISIRLNAANGSYIGIYGPTGQDWRPADDAGAYSCSADTFTASAWKNMTFNITENDALFYQDGELCYTFSGYGTIAFSTIDFYPRDNFHYYIDDFWVSTEDRPFTGNNPPILSGFTCTSCGGDNESPYYTLDTTPTFTFSSDINAWCRMGDENLNYTDMGAARNGTCSGQGTTSHTCTLDPADELPTPGQHNVYIGCKSSTGIENLSSSSGALLMQIGGASESDGDYSIELGIIRSEIGGSATIYDSQKVSAKNLNGDEFSGVFDKFAVYNNKRWAFNYVSAGESTLSGLFNISPALYVLQLQNATNATIVDQVGKLINSTWP